MRRMRWLVCIVAIAFSGVASADVGAALRVGTLGIGVDLDFGLTQNLNLRIGYSGYDYHDNFEETDVTYDGDVKLSNALALLDWHVLSGGFRLTFGAVGTNTSVDAVGQPTSGTYELDGQVFTAAEVGTLHGSIDMGNSVSPYVGLGWGNTVDKGKRITFLVDVGVIYMGTPEVNLTATCGPAAPVGSVNCNRLQEAVQVEEDQLADDASLYEWYPVVSVGLAVRF